MNRDRPDYDAQGVRLGAWTIYPSASSEIGYDDNPRSDHTDEKGSFVWNNSADVNAQGDWSGARVNLRTGVADYRYLNLSEQNYTNWNASASGMYELRQDWSMFGEAGHDARHELQDDPGNSGSSEPVAYTG